MESIRFDEGYYQGHLHRTSQGSVNEIVALARKWATSDKSQGLSDRYVPGVKDLKSACEFEAKIHEQQREFASFYDSGGYPITFFDKKKNRNVTYKDNDKDFLSVSWDKEEMDEIRIKSPSLLIHNHPYGWLYPKGNPERTGHSFSDVDIATSIALGLQETRVISCEAMYIMQPNPEKPWSPEYLLEVRPIMDDCFQKAKSFLETRVTKGEITETYFEAYVMHRTWLLFAQRTGCVYRRLPYPPDAYCDLPVTDVYREFNLKRSNERHKRFVDLTTDYIKRFQSDGNGSIRIGYDKFYKRVRDNLGRTSELLGISFDGVYDFIRFDKGSYKELLNNKYNISDLDKKKISRIKSDIEKYAADGYYDIPPEITERIVDTAEISPGDSVLVAGAGAAFGAIPDEIRARYGDSVTLDLIQSEEGELREMLKLKRYSVLDIDYITELKTDRRWDRVLLLTPPKRKDAARPEIAEIKKGYELLKSGGKAVGLVFETTYYSENFDVADFKDWVKKHGDFERLGQKISRKDAWICYASWRDDIELEIVFFKPKEGDYAENRFTGERYYCTEAEPQVKMRNLFTGSITTFTTNTYPKGQFRKLTEEEKDYVKRQLGNRSDFGRAGNSSDIHSCGANFKRIPTDDRKPKKPREIIVRPRFTHPPKKDYVSLYQSGTGESLSELVKDGRIKPSQAFGVNKALESLIINGAFYLADGTGVGKTTQELLTAHLLSTMYKKPALIITWAEDIMKDSFTKDARRLGIKWQEYTGRLKKNEYGIYIMHQYKLSSRDYKARNPKWLETIERPFADYEDKSDEVNQWRFKENPEDFAVVIFDEAHALKNSFNKTKAVAAKTKEDREKLTQDDDKRSRLGLFLSWETPRAMYASATNIDKIPHIFYLKRCGIYETNAQFDETMRKLGYIRKVGMPSGFPDSYQKERDFSEEIMLIELENVFERITEDGYMIKRDMAMDNVDLWAELTPVDSQVIADLNAVDRYWTARALAKGLGANAFNGQKMLHMARVAESYKIRRAICRIEDEVAQGRSVVVFTNGKADDESKASGILTPGASREIYRYCTERFGEYAVASLIDKTSSQREPEIMAFQEGRKKILISTTDAGGVGLSLDDTTGDRPRTLIITGTPNNVVKYVQAIGRVNRAKTASLTKVIALFAPVPIELVWKEKLTKKMKILGASVQGNVNTVLDLDDMEELISFSDDADTESIEEMDKHPLWKRKELLGKDFNKTYDLFHITKESRDDIVFSKSSRNGYIPSEVEKCLLQQDFEEEAYNFGTILKPNYKRAWVVPYSPKVWLLALNHMTQSASPWDDEGETEIKIGSVVKTTDRLIENPKIKPGEKGIALWYRKRKSTSRTYGWVYYVLFESGEYVKRVPTKKLTLHFNQAWRLPPELEEKERRLKYDLLIRPQFSIKDTVIFNENSNISGTKGIIVSFEKGNFEEGYIYNILTDDKRLQKGVHEKQIDLFDSSLWVVPDEVSAQVNLLIDDYPSPVVDDSEESNPNDYEFNIPSAFTDETKDLIEYARSQYDSISDADYAERNIRRSLKFYSHSFVTFSKERLNIEKAMLLWNEYEYSLLTNKYESFYEQNNLTPNQKVFYIDLASAAGEVSSEDETASMDNYIEAIESESSKDEIKRKLKRWMEGYKEALVIIYKDSLVDALNTTGYDRDTIQREYRKAWIDAFSDGKELDTRFFFIKVDVEAQKAFEMLKKANDELERKIQQAILRKFMGEAA